MSTYLADPALLDELRTAGHAELELSYVPGEDGAERFWLNCGFEPTVVSEVGKSWKDIWEMIIWNFS